MPRLGHSLKRRLSHPYYGTEYQDSDDHDNGNWKPQSQWNFAESSSTAVATTTNITTSDSLVNNATLPSFGTGTGTGTVKHPHYNTTETLQLTLMCLLWCLVGVGAVYLAVTERKRRRHRILRRRRARLEQFSPEDQAKRGQQLVELLAETTMVVRPEDLQQSNHYLWSNHYQADGGVDPDLEIEIGMQRNRKVQYMSHQNHHDESSQNGPLCEAAEDGSESTEKEKDETCLYQEHAENQHLVVAIDKQRDSAPVTDVDTSDDSSNEEEETEAEDDDQAWCLTLPIHKHNGDDGAEAMIVPAMCVICLKRYKVNDRVTWSPRTPLCRHAFHQKCLVSWLKKLPRCNCPCCRNVFCTIPPSDNNPKKAALVSTSTAIETAYST